MSTEARPATLDDVVRLLDRLVSTAHPPTLVSREEFAAMLAIAPSTFDRLRAAGEIGPRPVRLGGSLRWHRDEVDEWLRRRNHQGELFDHLTWPAVWKAALTIRN